MHCTFTLNKFELDTIHNQYPTDTFSPLASLICRKVKYTLILLVNQTRALLFLSQEGRHHSPHYRVSIVASKNRRQKSKSRLRLRLTMAWIFRFHPTINIHFIHLNTTNFHACFNIFQIVIILIWKVIARSDLKNASFQY